MRRTVGIMSGLALAAGVLGQGAPVQAAPPGWTVSCRVGEDEFASNCDATLHRNGLTVVLATADSQMFVAVSADGCRHAESSIQANWWRDEFLARGERGRRILLVKTIRDAAETLRTRCPGLPTRVSVGDPPDIAARGAP